MGGGHKIILDLKWDVEALCCGDREADPLLSRKFISNYMINYCTIRVLWLCVNPAVREMKSFTKVEEGSLGETHELLG